MTWPNLGIFTVRRERRGERGDICSAVTVLAVLYKNGNQINHQSSSLKNSIQTGGFGCNDLLILLKDPTISGVQSVRTEQSL